MRRAALLAAVLLIAACSSKSPEPSTSQAAAAPAELTRRQKDSILAQSKIPMAGAVGKAMGAADATSKQAAAHDSLLN